MPSLNPQHIDPLARDGGQAPEQRPISWANNNVADGRLVYAIGDIHGCYDELLVLLGMIAADANRRSAGRIPMLVFCGDYIDRGPASAHVLDALCWLQRHSKYDVTCLKGNHEAALLAFIEDPSQARAWLEVGGSETVVSYGLPPPVEKRSLAADERLRADLLNLLPVQHLRFLMGLQLMAILGDYAFAHAGIDPTRPLARQAERDLLWIRAPFLDAPGPFEKVIVHGHSWKDASLDLSNHRIGIDTGAYETGVLSAIRIEDREIGLLQTARGAREATRSVAP